MKDQLLAYFTGTTFGNVVERGQYASMERASSDVEMLGRSLCLYINDVYHLRPHRGIENQPPLNRFEDRFLTQGAPDVYTEERLRIAFGLEFMLPVTRQGVCFASNYYFSGRLQKFLRDNGRLKNGNPRMLRAKIDMTDLGRISVYFEGEWHTLAGPPRVRGKGFTDWNETRRSLSKLFGQQAAANAATVDRALRMLLSRGASAALKSQIRDMSYSSQEVVKAANAIKLRLKENETAYEAGALHAFTSASDHAAFPATGVDLDLQAELEAKSASFAQIEAVDDPYAEAGTGVRPETGIGLDNVDIDQDGDPLETGRDAEPEKSIEKPGDAEEQPESPPLRAKRPRKKSINQPAPITSFLPQPTRKKPS